MIVDHLCYGRSGGAALAALRIHDGLRKRGVDSRYWHASGLVPQDASVRRDASSTAQGRNTEVDAWTDAADNALRPLNWTTPFTPGSLGQLVRNVTRTARDLEVKFRHLRNRPDGFEYFSTGRLRYATPWPADQLVGDVLMLHWIGKLVDYPSFFGSLPADRPIVWVLHDMNPFTGGCHFSAGCNRFTQHCGNCPQIASASDRDITFQTLRMKRRLYEGLNLHVVSPSRWLSEQAKRSVPLAGAASHHVIPYGLETDRFAPADRLEARRALGLDPSKAIVLFGAASSDNRRKGFHLLVEAWPQLPSSLVQGVMFGAGEAPLVEAGQADIRHLGFVRDPERLRLIYSAADLFVLPSLEDNLPQTGMEAMACGTPVVAFAAGGIPDYVRPEQTGLLAPVGDSAALAQQVRRLIETPELARRLGANARKMMVAEFQQPIESARYLELLGSILAAQRSASRAA